MRRAVAYLRVSGRGQAGEGRDGLRRQLAKVQEYARAHRIELVEVFEDPGVSGVLPVLARPGFAALLERILSNGIDLILLERADRLARDLIESELALRELVGRGVSVLDVSAGEDLTTAEQDPSRRLIRQVLGAVAEWEKSTLVMKLRAARQRKRRETGRCEGAKRMGEVPGEVALLGAIEELRRGGASWQAVAEELNRRGFRNRQGRAWSRTAACEAFKAGRRARKRRR